VFLYDPLIDRYDPARIIAAKRNAAGLKRAQNKRDLAKLPSRNIVREP
jgi:hypothetical protein